MSYFAHLRGEGTRLAKCLGDVASGGGLGDFTDWVQASIGDNKGELFNLIEYLESDDPNALSIELAALLKRKRPSADIRIVAQGIVDMTAGQRGTFIVDDGANDFYYYCEDEVPTGDDDDEEATALRQTAETGKAAGTPEGHLIAAQALLDLGYNLDGNGESNAIILAAYRDAAKEGRAAGSKAGHLLAAKAFNCVASVLSELYEDDEPKDEEYEFAEREAAKEEALGRRVRRSPGTKGRKPSITPTKAPKPQNNSTGK